MNPWAPVKLSMILENLLDTSRKPGIFSAMLRWVPIFPAIIAALRNFKSFAEDRDRGVILVLCNKLIFYSWLREKMPIAFLVCHAPDEEDHSLV
jgi:hypothetical protein